MGFGTSGVTAESANPLKSKYQNGTNIDSGRRESVKINIPKRHLTEQNCNKEIISVLHVRRLRGAFDGMVGIR